MRNLFLYQHSPFNFVSDPILSFDGQFTIVSQTVSFQNIDHRTSKIDMMINQNTPIGAEFNSTSIGVFRFHEK